RLRIKMRQAAQRPSVKQMRLHAKLFQQRRQSVDRFHCLNTSRRIGMFHGLNIANHTDSGAILAIRFEQRSDHGRASSGKSTRRSGSQSLPCRSHKPGRLSMNRVPLIDRNNTSAERKQTLDAIHAAFGTTPKMFRAVANSPAALNSMWGSFAALGDG